MKSKILIIAFFLIFGASFLYLFVQQKIAPVVPNGNQNTNANPVPLIGSNSDIAHFSSYDEFQKFMTQIAQKNSVGAGLFRNEVMMDMVAAPTMVGDGTEAPSGFGGATKSSDESSLDYSGTNIQVAGVDEADIIKSDGSYLYIASGSSVVIIDAHDPDNASIVSEIKLSSSPQNIYVNGTHLAVFGFDQRQYYGSDELNGLSIVPVRPSNQIFLKVYDTNDKVNPMLVRDLTFEGSISDSRMIGDYMYLVTSDYNGCFGVACPLPRIWEEGKMIAGNTEAPSFVMPDVYYFPIIPYESVNLTSISAINIVDPSEEINSDVYVLDANQSMYVSPDNIYITYTQFLNEQGIQFDIVKEMVIPKLSGQDRTRISEIEQTQQYILSEFEKQQKILEIIGRYMQTLSAEDRTSLEQRLESRMKVEVKKRIDELEKTIIHKIAISDGAMTYQVAGEVSGHVINQFAMDEHDGYFRIATTRGRMWSQFLDDSDRESYNNLYILDGNLKRVGSVEHIAPNEQIYSVRFMQGRAYMVTFEQVDPLFVIDVSEPTSPHILGELKIPGFSNYLHPYDETTLIGLGRETILTDSGGVRTQGIKISLFDVSNVSNIVETAKFVIGDSSEYSPALDDHKAFMFSKEKNLLAIPVRGDFFSIRDFDPGLAPIRDGDFITSDFNGVYVFDIQKESLELRGIIDHTPRLISSEKRYVYNDVLRSLYIGDTLYSLSSRYVKANSLKDLSLIKTIELPNIIDRGFYPEPILFESPGVMIDEAIPVADEEIVF